MKRDITFAGKKITLATSGVSPIIYKTVFHRDYFADVNSIISSVSEAKNGAEAFSDLLNSGSATLLLNFIWLYAKNADDSIKEQIEWLKQFDDAPFTDLWPLVDLIGNSIETKKG